MKIKKLEWSEPKKSPHFKYDYYIQAETPLQDITIVYSDKFYGIEGIHSFDVGVFEDGLTVDDLKEIAEKSYQDRILSCLEEGVQMND